MVDVRGDVLRPPHGTTPPAVKSNIKSESLLNSSCVYLKHSISETNNISENTHVRISSNIMFL